jgi:hypothetical protein
MLPDDGSPADKTRLSLDLMEALVQGQGMNDFLSRLLDVVTASTGAARVILYDYDEGADRFDLLYFRGYPDSARSDLRRLLVTLDIRRALEGRSPFQSRVRPGTVLVPLCFQETLEAVLLVEFEQDGERGLGRLMPVAAYLSRFLGLFMSSNRLPVNRRHNAGTSDLARAREIQMSFLPAAHQVTDRYEIFGFNQSSALVGGDYFDYFSRRKQSVQCVVADACGHGMAAALIMTNFRGMLQSEVSRFEQFENLFTDLNRRLYTAGELVQYLTCVLFNYDEETRDLHYFNAGHFDPILVHQDGSTSRLPGGGPPLGMFDFSVYNHQRRAIQPGDLMVLFTDGLAELRNARDEFFGVDRIVGSVRESAANSLREIAHDVLGSASRFSGTAEPEDDITLFLMRFR